MGNVTSESTMVCRYPHQQGSATTGILTPSTKASLGSVDLPEGSSKVCLTNFSMATGEEKRKQYWTLLFLTEM